MNRIQCILEIYEMGRMKDCYVYYNEQSALKELKTRYSKALEKYQDQITESSFNTKGYVIKANNKTIEKIVITIREIKEN